MQARAWVAEYSKDFVEVLAVYLRIYIHMSYISCFSLPSHASALAYARTPRGKLARVTLAYLPIHALAGLLGLRLPALDGIVAPLAGPGGP